MIDPRVLEKMNIYMTREYGNAASNEHAFGWNANEAVNIAREKISNSINCSPNEIYFTSGATESNNLAILGSINLQSDNSHIISLKTEHKSVIDIFNYASINNINTTLLNVKQDGMIDLDIFEKSITSNTKLVSIMMANNEIGVIQPIPEISRICKKHNVILHVDAAQALGKIKFDLINLDIDLMSLSAHKIYGPKGIGALYVNRKTMKNRIKSITYGGGHENGLRPGTLPVHNIVGFGEACEIIYNEINDNTSLITELTDLMLQSLNNGYPGFILNGHSKIRIPGNLNISFPDLKEEPLIQRLRKIAVSSGSACTTSSPEPSHVLSALGINNRLINSTIRIGIGKFNTINDIKDAANYILKVVNKLKIKKNIKMVKKD